MPNMVSDINNRWRRENSCTFNIGILSINNFEKSYLITRFDVVPWTFISFYCAVSQWQVFLPGQKKKKT